MSYDFSDFRKRVQDGGDKPSDLTRAEVLEILDAVDELQGEISQKDILLSLQKKLWTDSQAALDEREKRLEAWAMARDNFEARAVRAYEDKMAQQKAIAEAEAAIAGP